MMICEVKDRICLFTRDLGQGMLKGSDLSLKNELIEIEPEKNYAIESPLDQNLFR